MQQQIAALQETRHIVATSEEGAQSGDAESLCQPLEVRLLVLPDYEIAHTLTYLWRQCGNGPQRTIHALNHEAGADLQHGVIFFP